MKLKELILESPRLSEWCAIGPVQKAQVYDLVDKVIDECSVVVYSAIYAKLPVTAYAGLMKEELGLWEM